jgi:hypothetical protein
MVLSSEAARELAARMRLVEAEEHYLSNHRYTHQFISISRRIIHGHRLRRYICGCISLGEV